MAKIGKNADSIYSIKTLSKKLNKYVIMDFTSFQKAASINL